MSKAAWRRLRQSVIACRACPRLVDHLQQIADQPRRSYRDQTYWSQPVPNFGQPNVALLVIGLAPGAHGANRTGRMFTGDRSGDWLFRALYRAGFASQPNAVHRRDGLQLQDAAITNLGRCAPPQNRPAAEELNRCRPFLLQTLELSQPRVVVALGGMAWQRTLAAMVELDWYRPTGKRPRFGHGVEAPLVGRRRLIGSYHPSQQNTFTGRLTEPMLDAVFRRARQWIDGDGESPDTKVAPC